MVATESGCAFERHDLWNEHLFFAGGAIAIEPSIRAHDDGVVTSLADHERIAATDACHGAPVG